MTDRVLQGKVGFFWIVPGKSGEAALLGEALGLDQAEQYGDALTHPMGHYEFWETMRKRGPAFLRGRGVRASILADEYEHWPRGRVTYQLASTRFDIFAHKSIVQPPSIELVYRTYELARATVRLRADSHYKI